MIAAGRLVFGATPPTPKGAIMTTTQTAVFPVADTEMRLVVGVVHESGVAAVLDAIHAHTGLPGWSPMTRREAILKYPEGHALDAPDWEAADGDRFSWVARKAADRTLLGFLHVAQQGELAGDEIAAMTDYKDAEAWRAALPHVRAYCSRVDRKPIWSVHEHTSSGRAIYTMRDEVRALALEHLGHLS
jgi:hypothetical protein